MPMALRNAPIYVPLLKKCVDDANSANLYPDDINLSFMFLSMQRLILVEVFNVNSVDILHCYYPSLHITVREIVFVNSNTMNDEFNLIADMHAILDLK